MKDLRYLALFVLMALLSACDLTTAKAPPLVVSLPQSTAVPQVVAAKPAESNRRLIPSGLKVDAGIPALVTDRWYALAYMYPDVAKRITRIAARKVVKGWVISYEAQTLYINTWYGDYVLADKVTEQFARRAYDHLRRHQPNAAKSFRSWKVFAAWLRTGVK
jgi:hypothetical protein